MADGNLSQPEADALIAMDKHRVDDTPWEFPGPGGKLDIPLKSADGREEFRMNVYRGKVVLAKATYQNRARISTPLVRLDLSGGTHTNPDGEPVPCPHLHLYRQGYGDKWAIPAPAELLNSANDLYSTLSRFMDYCRVTEPPTINRSLF